MRDEMEYRRLEVILIPSKNHECAIRGGCIRVAINTNPEWYQELCSSYPRPDCKKWYKTRTIIKRANIIKLLDRLLAGQKINSKYEQDLNNIVDKIKKSGMLK